MDPATPLDYGVGRRDAEVVKMVASALEEGRAMLAYQPVVSATSPYRVAFQEALMRIPDPTGHLIPACDFMPAAECRAIGRDIDTLALDLGCAALSRVPSLRLSINMSARSIGYGPWLETLERWLKQDSTLGPRLILEITESSAMTVPELVIDFMNRLQMQGVCFALDDFGSGYTALRYFKDFFFDILKIDGQFIRGISEDPDNFVLTKAMLSIGHQFDMLCVAEMVETAEDARVLAEIGADCLQGYYFGAARTRPDWLEQADIVRSA